MDFWTLIYLEWWCPFIPKIFWKWLVFARGILFLSGWRSLSNGTYDRRVTADDGNNKTGGLRWSTDIHFLVWRAEPYSSRSSERALSPGFYLPRRVISHYFIHGCPTPVSHCHFKTIFYSKLVEWNENRYVSMPSDGAATALGRSAETDELSWCLDPQLQTPNFTKMRTRDWLRTLD